MNRFTRMARNPWLAGAVAALLAYTLAGFLLIPALIRHYVPKLATDVLARQASIGEVRFNPFTFTLEAKDLAFDEADGSPVLALGRLFIDLEPGAFLTTQTFTIAEVHLDNPALDVVRDREGLLNLARIAQALPREETPPPPPDEAPPRVRLKRLNLRDGAIKYTDSSASTAAVIDHLGLELTDITTLAEKHGAYRIEAALPDGGKLAWKGDVTLMPLASSGEFAVESLHLATLWKFAKDRLNLAEPAGFANLAAHYRFSQSRDRTDLAVDEGAIRINGLVLQDAEGPLLRLDEIACDKASFDLAAQTVTVPQFSIRNGHLRAAMDDTGQLNWQRLSKPERPAAPPVASRDTPAQRPWRVAMDRFTLSGVGIDYADASRKEPFTVSVADLAFAFKALAEAGAGAPKASIDGFELQLNRIALAQPGAPKPLLGFDAFALEGGHADLEKREVAIARAQLRGGSTAVAREADGSLRPLGMFQANAGRPAEPPPQEDSGTRPAWNFALAEFSLQDFAVGLADRSFSPELNYDLELIQISARNISSDGKKPVDYDVRLNVRQGGSLEASGNASPSGDAATARVKIEHFDLKQLRTVVSRYAALELESAALSTDLDLSFHRAEPAPQVRAKGKADLDGLKLIQTVDRKTFLAWKTLGVSGIDFSLQPDKLAIKEVRILRPETIIHIFKDRSTNIAAIAKPQKASPASKASTTGRKDKERPFPLTVARIRVDDAEIDFADESLVLPFATHVTDFDGAVTGISLAPGSKAQVKFAGRVDEYGEALVDGTLSPMDPKNFSHVDVVFNNVAMASLSPYSATFAGRRIQSGKLNLDLKYRIENGRLESENDILLENFVLGERVESPNALNLPLDLAVALLTDREGRIRASVPVTGDVGNPQFSYGTVVRDAFVTVITKAVTAPFDALASMFGGQEEALDAVLFQPGNDVIAPREREKLVKVAAFLAQRPQLDLTVSGRFQPDADGKALRSLQVRRALAEKMDITLHEGEEPDTPGFGDAPAQRALEKLAAERGGVENVQSAYVKETGRKPERVGALAGLVGKASGTPEFYERLYEHLVATAPLPPPELEALAERRGRAVLSELLKIRLDRTRVSVERPGATDDTTNGRVPTKLQLNTD